MRPEQADLGRGPEVWTVDSITRELKGLIEGAFGRVQVEGEVVSCRPASSGHVYFQLRGKGATLSAVMFRSAAQRARQTLRDGDLVVCSGSIELYPPHGRYQLVVQSVRWGGEGELLAALEELKRKLAAEGLFDASRKRPIPYLPRRIAVVTSPTGAAIRDIVRSIHERFSVPILLAPAPVQGRGAAARIVQAMQQAASVSDVDVIVVGRGGGSLQDLWEFNDEQLARAIARCPKPVISAVGHEIDTLLSDLVADARAATPTAVGELVVPDRGELAARLAEHRERLARGLLSRVRRAGLELQARRSRLVDPRRLVRERWLRLDELEARLQRAGYSQLRDAGARLEVARQRLGATHPAARLGRERLALEAARARLERGWLAQLERHQAQLRERRARLTALSPRAALGRGYAIVRKRPERAILRSAGDVQAGDPLEIMLVDGVVDATVTSGCEQ